MRCVQITVILIQVTAVYILTKHLCSRFVIHCVVGNEVCTGNETDTRVCTLKDTTFTQICRRVVFHVIWS